MSDHVFHVICNWTFPEIQSSRGGWVGVGAKYVFLGFWRQFRCQAEGKRGHFDVNCRQCAKK
jgi:hypothetical protein